MAEQVFPTKGNLIKAKKRLPFVISDTSLWIENAIFLSEK